MSRWLKKLTPDFWKTVLLSLVTGFIAGALGTMAIWSSLLAYQTSLIADSTPTLDARRREASTFAGVVGRIRRDVVPVLATIFVAPDRDAPERYLPAEAVGQGVVLTADGWIITHRTVFDPQRASVAVGVGPLVLPAVRIIEDEETGALFLKVAAENLRAAAFGKGSELASGAEVFAPLGAHRLGITRIDEVRVRPAPFASSDKLEAWATMTDELDRAFAGGPLVNEHGEVVGVLVAEEAGVRTALPVEHLEPFLAGLFSAGTLARPTLGVHGFHLSGGWKTDGGRERGFLVSADPRDGTRGVIRGSPAEQAGIRTGDIILKVKDTVVNGDLDLAELLLAFKPGETIDLEIRRGSGEVVETVTVTLGERKSGKEY